MKSSIKHNAPWAPRRRFGRARLLAVAMAAAMISGSAAAHVIFPGVADTSVSRVTVSTSAELVAAVKGATQATEILLRPGTYNNVDIKGVNPTFDIVVRSLDNTNRAEMRRLLLYSVDRLRFERINFPHVLSPGESLVTPNVRLSLATNVSFSNCNFFGSLDGDPNNDGILLRVAGSSRLLLFNNSFQQARVAFSLDRTDRALVVSNRVFDVREGSNFIVVNKVYIERNHYSRIFPNEAAGDHSDAVQFWPDSGLSSSNVFIRNNAFLLDRSTAQGIFISANPPSPQHRNFTIRDNLIYSRVRHGITIGGVRTALVERNTVVTAPHRIYDPAILVDNASGITVRRNISPLLLYTPTATYTASNNVDLMDSRRLDQPSAESQLMGPLTGNDPPLSAFTVRPNSLAAELGAGAVIGSNIGGVAGTVSAIESAFQTQLARVRALS